MTTASTEIAHALVAAVSQPSPETLEALRPYLADNVMATGLFVSAAGVDSVLDGIRNSQPPVLTMATFGEVVVQGDQLFIPGRLPPGLPLRAVNLLVSTVGDKVVEVVQEVEEAASEPEVGMRIDENIARFVDGAFDRRSPLVLAYVDEDGLPQISFRGTIQSYTDDALAMWIRNPNGGLLRAIESRPHVAIIGSDPETRLRYEFYGRARIVVNAEEQNAIFDKSPTHERNIDAAKRGVAVAIDIDELKGGSLGNSVHRRRSS